MKKEDDCYTQIKILISLMNIRSTAILQHPQKNGADTKGPFQKKKILCKMVKNGKLQGP